MKRLGIAVVAVLPLVFLACRHKEAPPYPTSFNDESAEALRIGRYLEESVVATGLRSCWGQLQGDGVIAMDLMYRKAGSNWTFDKVSVTKSTLASGQDTLAQRCVESSARGTAFPVESKDGLETAAPAFVVRLGWMVPMPPEGAQLSSAQIARMSGSGAGAVTVPGCSACVSRTEYPYGLKCESRKSGSDKDCEEINSNTCATTPTACLRGGFSGTGGVIMF
jgi:hypothetical protein